MAQEQGLGSPGTQCPLSSLMAAAGQLRLDEASALGPGVVLEIVRRM